MAQQAQEFKHIVRIANTDLKGEKPISVALSNIKGVGKNFSIVVCHLADIKLTTKTGSLSHEEVQRINDILQKPAEHNIPSWFLNRRKDAETGADMHKITTDLDWAHSNDLKHQKKIKSYKGIRHMFRLPVRGQRTRSNFRRNKGKVTGVAKKKGKGGK